MNLMESALNFIFPPVCGLCRELSDSYLCNKCLEQLEKQEENILLNYSDKYFDSYFGIFEYKDEIRDRIIEYKFGDSSYLYRFFVEIILQNSIAVDYIQKFDYIIPVPLHKKRLKKRGYNQTELIAKAIGKSFIDIKYCKNILEKVRNTEPQSTLNKEARAKNVKGAFRINPFVEISAYKNKSILLLDDIYTTGNTANECSKLLKQQLECKKVGIFTIAKD